MSSVRSRKPSTMVIAASGSRATRGIWSEKFIFLMKYRGPTFCRRYNHESAAGYDSNDRERMLDYMRKKGFERPIDVWLDNIEAVIDLDMDEELRWISTSRSVCIRTMPCGP